MTFIATISSQGQVTIPAKVRRHLGLHKKVVLDIAGGSLVVKPMPTSEDIWAVLDAPAKGLGLSRREKESAWVQAAIAKDKHKRGY